MSILFSVFIKSFRLIMQALINSFLFFFFREIFEEISDFINSVWARLQRGKYSIFRKWRAFKINVSRNTDVNQLSDRLQFKVIELWSDVSLAWRSQANFLAPKIIISISLRRSNDSLPWLLWWNSCVASIFPALHQFPRSSTMLLLYSKPKLEIISIILSYLLITILSNQLISFRSTIFH